jgi:hypothetical protein
MMNTSQPFIRLTLTLGIITLIALILSSLALIDIYKSNEADLTAEWNMVRVSFSMTGLFIFASLIILWKMRKER